VVGEVRGLFFPGRGLDTPRLDGLQIKSRVKEAFMAHRDDWIPRREQIWKTKTLWMQVTALEKAGKHEEAASFRKKYIPLPVWGAKVMKKFCGADYIRS